MTACLELLNDRLYCAVVVERALLEPVVVLDAVLQQVGFKALLVQRKCIIRQCLAALLLGLLRKSLSAVQVVVILRMLNYIHAKINVGGHGERKILLFLGNIALLVRGGGLVVDSLCQLLHIAAALRDDLLTGFAAQLHVAQVKGLAELCHLVACVVDVEFTADLVASLLEQGGKAVAQRAAARVAYMHGSGRIRRNKLHQNTLALAQVSLAVVVAHCDSIPDNALKPALADEEVQACDLDLTEVGSGEFHGIRDHLRDRSWVALQRLCGNKSRVG